MTPQNKPFKDAAVELLLMTENTFISSKLRALGDKGISADK